MTDNSNTLRGFRISNGDTPARVVTPNHMVLPPNGEKALADLREAAAVDRPNCLNREDEFSGEEVVPNWRARALCSGCPIFEKCETYAKVTKPAWGVHAGKWYGEE